MTTKTKTKKLVKTKAELTLANKLSFKGKYVESLLESAAQHCKLEGERLPNAQSYLALIARQRAQRIKAKWGLSVLAFDRLVAKGKQILRDFRTGYSMGEVKTIEVGDEWFLRVDDTQEYSRSSKYQAKHGDLKIRIDLLSLRKIEKIQGVWTVIRSGNRASWLQSRGTKGSYEVYWVHGFLVGSSHGATLEECELLEAGKAVRAQDGKVKRLDRFIGLRDRVAAGACEAGVLAFCDRNGLNPDFGYRIDYLLSLGDDIAASYLTRVARLLKR
jgi:hypothetical protein